MRRLAALTSQLPRYVNTATVWTVADRYQPATRTANPNRDAFVAHVLHTLISTW